MWILYILHINSGSSSSESHSVMFDSVTSMDASLPASSLHRILQARILKSAAISFSRGSYKPREQTWVSCIAGKFFIMWATRETP